MLLLPLLLLPLLQVAAARPLGRPRPGEVAEQVPGVGTSTVCWDGVASGLGLLLGAWVLLKGLSWTCESEHNPTTLATNFSTSSSIFNLE